MKMKSIVTAAILLLTSANLLAQSNFIKIEREPVVKVTPQFGITKIKNDYLDYNSTISTGASVDFMVSSRFSVGAIFNYSLFELYGNQYTYNVQEMDLKQYNVGVQTKFFIIPDGVVRPFIGVGVSYVHNKLDYADDNQSYYHSFRPAYDSGYSFGNIAGSIVAGSELRFSRNVGLVLDAKYSGNLATGLNRSLDNESSYGRRNSLVVPYEMGSVEYNLEDAYSVSGNIGLVILF
ncbi:MAG: hypothetical protein DRQ88_08165 [Epsilonproteobacteria bacterium]|nr:MAG: hypothetical protein DRQ89_09185 [Campylobacterota bacterium]RLA66023.1 MAG: hypothetical protein DRQ88_08165 [Campylobacterota bacterium]